MTQKSKKQLKEFLSWLTIFLTISWVLLFLYGLLVEQRININLEKANGHIKTIEVTKPEANQEEQDDEQKRRLLDAVETLEDKEVEPAKPEDPEAPAKNPTPSSENTEEKPADLQPNLDKIEKEVTVNFREASSFDFLLSNTTKRLG